MTIARSVKGDVDSAADDDDDDDGGGAEATVDENDDDRKFDFSLLSAVYCARSNSSLVRTWQRALLPSSLKVNNARAPAKLTKASEYSVCL